jgi:hypothetical protein
VARSDLVDVPVVLVEEGADRNGPTDSRILDRLPAGTPTVAKTSFGIGGCPEAMDAIAATRRSSVVLTGFETNTCKGVTFG